MVLIWNAGNSETYPRPHHLLHRYTSSDWIYRKTRINDQEYNPPI